MIFIIERGNAVFGYLDGKSAHQGVGRGVEYADVCHHARDDEGFDAEGLERLLQIRVVKSQLVVAKLFPGGSNATPVTGSV